MIICTCSYVVALSIPIIIIIVIVFVRMLNVIGPKSMGECLLMMTMIMVLFVCYHITWSNINCRLWYSVGAICICQQQQRESESQLKVNLISRGVVAI